jgi:hypothetical protein
VGGGARGRADRQSKWVTKSRAPHREAQETTTPTPLPAAATRVFGGPDECPGPEPASGTAACPCPGHCWTTRGRCHSGCLRPPSSWAFCHWPPRPPGPPCSPPGQRTRGRKPRTHVWLQAVANRPTGGLGGTKCGIEQDPNVLAPTSTRFTTTSTTGNRHTWNHLFLELPAKEKGNFSKNSPSQMMLGPAARAAKLLLRPTGSSWAEAATTTTGGAGSSVEVVPASSSLHHPHVRGPIAQKPTQAQTSTREVTVRGQSDLYPPQQQQPQQ